MKNLTLIVLFIIIFSCSEKKELKLTILNESFKVYRPEMNISTAEYKTMANNIIHYKIENKSNSIYILVSEKLNYFPKANRDLHLENIMFFDANNQEPKYSNTTAQPSDLNFFNYLDYKEKIKESYYENIGYGKKKEYWKFINSHVLNASIKIYPSETLYFETYACLPYKSNEITADFSGVIFDYTKTYFAKLKFKFKKAEAINKYLTDIQKKQFVDNEYKIFDEELISTNQVPVEFIE